MKKLIKFLIASAIALLPVVAKAAVVVGPISTVFYKDEGVTVSTSPNTIDFVGSGVTVTKNGVSSMTVTIPGGGGGGSGDITSVTAGTGLSGGGVTGAVTLSLDPNATSYVRNGNTLQTPASYYVDRGWIQSGLSIGTSAASSVPLHFGPVNGTALRIDNTGFSNDANISWYSDPFGSGQSLAGEFGMLPATGRFRFKGSSSQVLATLGSNDSQGFMQVDTIETGKIGISYPKDISASGSISRYSFYWRVNASAAPVIITLPDVDGLSTPQITKHAYIFCKTDSSTNTVTFVGGDAGDTVSDNSTLYEPSQCVLLISSYTQATDNGQWYVANKGGWGNIFLDAQKSIKFADSDSSNFVGMKSTAAVTSNYTLIWPGAAGSVGQLPKITSIVGTDVFLDFANDNNSGGGGGTTMWIQDGGSDIVQTSTINFSGPQFVVTSVSGKASVELNSSSVTLQGPLTASSPITLTSGAFGVDSSSVTLLGPSIDVSGGEITGVLKAASFPALTGDVTTSAGSLTTTVIDDSHNHTVATSTFAVTGGTFTVTGGTTTFGGVTYKWPQAQATGTKILSNDGTGQLSWATDATSAGGGDNLGTHVATRTLDMAGFPIINVSSIGVLGSGPSIIDVGTNTAISFVVNGSTWDLNASSLTYRGTAALIGTNIAASSVTLTAFYSDNAVRSNLGLAIGTNVQAWDADLDDLADGSLTGSKVGSGVPAANIASGSLGSSVIASSISATALVSSFPVTGATAGSYTNANITINAQGFVTAASNGSAGGGGSSSLEVFSNFDGTKSSPTASIALGDSLNLSVSGSTATLDVDLSSITAAVGTFTNKTFDAQGTGNIMAFLDTWQWNNADSLFTGTTYYTTTSTNPMYGHGTFAASNSTSTCGVYFIGNAGADFDTATDLTMLLYDFTGGVDTSSRTYIVSVATYTTGMNLSTMTYGSPITVTISNFSVGGLNRRGVSASTTLTGWKSVLSANADFAVAVRRQGDSATLDVSTIDSYFGGAVITRGRRQ